MLCAPSAFLLIDLQGALIKRCLGLKTLNQRRKCLTKRKSRVLWSGVVLSFVQPHCPSNFQIVQPHESQPVEEVIYFIMELTNEGPMVRVDVGGSSSTKLISKDQEFPAEINFNYKKCFFF
ncbi:hypothetical protein GmHk_13G037444 [Glycine max]|nr:hypothetical protein GmHk_13G037444 [Glycine max]